MVSFGVLLLILGIGSFILPLLGLQFRILSIFGPNQEIVAIGMAVVGAVLVVLGLSRGRQRAPEATGTTAPTPTPTPGQEWSSTRVSTPTAATSAMGGGTAPTDPQAPPKPVPAPERAPGAGLESAQEPPVMGTTLPPSSSRTGLEEEAPAVAEPRATPPNPPQD
jgi:hypothetical protein